jgi:hypothetical protein
MGLVPREHSTGGQQKLLGISKRGNSYLRKLFVQGARAVLQQRTKQSSGLSAWLAQLRSRTHRNVAAVALANKLARIAWAVLMISCQVCWRTRRWHNGRTRRSPNPESETVYQGCLVNGEESAAHSILARSDPLQQRPYTFAQTNL